MRHFLVTGVAMLLASQAYAQTPGSGERNLATPAGHDVSVGISSYAYHEPNGDTPIKIHAPKFAAEYTGTLLLGQRRRLFLQAQGRGIVGNTTYNGWCSPFFIAPNGASPNGYELDIGDASPCDESGDRDWYIEGRALAGKDLIGQRWAWSPYSGIGLRHLSNGTTGSPGYRTDDYLYVPIGITARTSVASRAVSVNVEVDALLHGWQKTRDSYLGSGDVPATPAAPAFSIDGFTDVSFSQSGGWALRTSGAYPVARHWSLEPYYIYWHVSASPVNNETVAFTVNNVQAHEQLGAYEPVNYTHEFGIRLGLHF